MKKTLDYTRRYCGSIALAVVAVLTSSLAAQAETVTVSVDLPVAGEPRAVTGIALGPSLEMISAVSLKRFAADSLTVTFNVPSQASAALAMAEMADGTTIFGDTRLIETARVVPSLASIPECSVNGVIKADASQRGLMQSLVEIRAARRDVLKNRLKALLNTATLDKARKLEELFGLARTAPLSTDLSPTEIIDRVTRLSAAIKSYRSNRASKGTAERK